MPVTLFTAAAAEFIGTFALCLGGILALHHAPPSGPGNLLLVALAEGLTYAVMSTACLPTSGGHLNPAVTAGFLLTGKIQPRAAAIYMVAQVAAGVTAALTIALLFRDVPGIVARGAPAPALDIDVPAALLAEMLGTFALVFVIWGTVAEPRARDVGGFASGLTLTVCILALGPLTGGSFNPARSFGPVLVGSLVERVHGLWAAHWVYWLGPLLGGPMAALVYHLILWPRDDKRGIDPAAQAVPPTQR